MKNSRVKGYWLKQKETFSKGKEARQRATLLRSDQHTSHVIMDKEGDAYVVRYSVAKWYVEELKKAGIKL